MDKAAAKKIPVCSGKQTPATCPINGQTDCGGLSSRDENIKSIKMGSITPVGASGKRKDIFNAPVNDG